MGAHWDDAAVSQAFNPAAAPFGPLTRLAQALRQAANEAEKHAERTDEPLYGEVAAHVEALRERADRLDGDGLDVAA